MMPVVQRISGKDFTDRSGKTISPRALVFLCDHPGCAEYASQGFGVALLKNKPGRWFCKEHIPTTNPDGEGE